jgi:hypothetical protein
VFDPGRIRELAAALQTNERYIEKDWHLVRALGVIAALKVEGVRPIFSGGTSLATAWQLIRRFSEDIDFKVEVKAASPSAERKIRSAYRESLLNSLSDAGFVLDGAPLVGNMSRFFRASFHYGAIFPAAAGVRSTLKVEMTFSETQMGPLQRPIQSLLARALKAAPEVTALFCVDPIETAADKVSALAWRTAVRDRKAKTDDPAIVRHLHDLAALAPTTGASPLFGPLAHKLLEIDARRTGAKNADGRALLEAMLPTITGDPLWRKEYEAFVGAVSFGPEAGRISFDQAIAACETLVGKTLEAAG